MSLTISRLKSLLEYFPDTGRFVWKVSIGNVKAGSPAGCDNGAGYVKIRIDNKKYRAHRLAWVYVYGVWPNKDLDHKDRVRNNNAISNLREATPKENRANSICPPPPPRFAQKGEEGSVWFRKDRNVWRVRLRVNGKHQQVGHFKTKGEADAALERVREKLAPSIGSPPP